MTLNGYPHELLLVNPFLFLILALAAFRLTRLLTTDAILEDVRNSFWNKYPPNTKLGYLWTCDWCMGFWVALIVFGLWLVVPQVTIVVSLILSISAVIGLLSAWTDR
jgi:hypothetical protein